MIIFVKKKYEKRQYYDDYWVLSFCLIRLLFEVTPT